MESLFSKSKKGNVELVTAGVLAIAMAGFLLVMGLIMMDEMMISTATDTVTVYNETIASVTEAGVAVATVGKCGFNSFNVLYMGNLTGAADDAAIDAANYTSTSRDGKVYTTADTSAGYNDTDWNVSYTYKYGSSESCLATNQTIFGQGRFADYFDLIILAIIIAVVISLITVGFAMRRTR